MHQFRGLNCIITYRNFAKDFFFESLELTVASRNAVIENLTYGGKYIIIRARGSEFGVSDSDIIYSGADTIWESTMASTSYSGLDIAYVQATSTKIILNGKNDKCSYIYFSVN